MSHKFLLCQYIMNSTDPAFNQGMVRNILKQRYRELAQIEEPLKQQREEEKQIASQLRDQARIDDIKVEQNFKSLDDKVKEKRLDAQVRKFLTSIQQKAGEGKNISGDLNSIKRFVSRDVELSDDTKKAVNKVITGLDVSRIPVSTNELKRYARDANDILNNLFLSNPSEFKDSFLKAVQDMNLQNTGINQLSKTQFKDLAGRVGFQLPKEPDSQLFTKKANKPNAKLQSKFEEFVRNRQNQAQAPAPAPP